MKGLPIIVAFDPGINETGFAVLDGQDTHSGVIRANGDDAQRIRQIAERAYAMLKPKCMVIIETPSAFTYNRSSRGGKTLNAGSMAKVNWVVGALVAVAGFHGCQIYMISPQEWKGNQPKEVTQMQTGIKNHNESDALMLAQWWVRIGIQIRLKNEIHQ